MSVVISPVQKIASIQVDSQWDMVSSTECHSSLTWSNLLPYLLSHCGIFEVGPTAEPSIFNNDC